MAVPYTFANQSGNIPLAQLDANFSALSGTVTQVEFSTGTTGLTATGSPITTSGTITLSGTLNIANGGTGTTSAPAAMAALMGFTTTVTSTSPYTLTAASTYYQLFTGTNTQQIFLPSVGTLALGWTYHICNNGTNNLIVNSSGGNPVITVLPNTTAMVTCILVTGTTAASWEAGFTDFSTATGTGDVVLGTSPTITSATLVTPALGTPASGILSGCTVDGTNAVGFRTVPVNDQITPYTAALTDSGKVISHPASDPNARTFTIPANSVTAFPIGTVLTFANMTSQVVSIAINTDTMYLAGTGATGTRSLAQYGMASALKLTATTWLISGNGLT